MKPLRRTTAVLAAALLGTAAMLATAPPAGAATNPYTPTGVCGTGYRVISSKPATTDAGAKYGGVYLLYKSGGYNCVVTIKWTSIGVATDTMAALYRDSEDSSQNLIDQGNFKYYAVVRGYAPQCISYAGWVGDAVAASGWGWCD